MNIKISDPMTACPECKVTGKVVQGQTVKALLSVSIRLIESTPYYFCSTQTCPVVYYSQDGRSTFRTSQVRERVFQKEPHARDVLICYCFYHTAGEVRSTSADGRVAILADINTGVKTDQCACDLRNPQGSCCLGNVRSLIKQLERSVDAINTVK
jgi:hypothetical protein